MKALLYMLLAMVVLMAYCAVTLYLVEWPDMDMVQNTPLSDCELLEWKDGRISRQGELTLSADDEKRLRSWLSTLRGDAMSISIVTYVPRLVLRNKDMSINFSCSRLLVVNGTDAKTGSYQVTRPMSQLDEEMLEWLRTKLPAEP